MKGIRIKTLVAMLLAAVMVVFGGTAFAAPDLQYKAGPLHTMAQVDTVLKENNIGLDTEEGHPITTGDELRLFLQGVGVDTGKPMYLLLSADGSGWRITNTPPAGPTEEADGETRRRRGFSGIELKNAHRHRIPASEITGTSAEAALNQILAAEKSANNLLSIEMKGDYGIANVTYITASGEDLERLITILKQQIQENGDLRGDYEKLLHLINGHLEGGLKEFQTFEKQKRAFEEYLKDHPRDVELIGLVKELAQALEASPFQRGGGTVAVGVTQGGVGNNQAVGNDITQITQTLTKGDVYGEDFSFTVNNLVLGYGGTGGTQFGRKTETTRIESLPLPQRASPVAVYHLPPDYRRWQ